MTFAPHLTRRIKKLEELREQVLQDELSNINITPGMPSKTLSHSSYRNLLDLHIALLKEVKDVVKMIADDDTKKLKEWYDNRKS